MEIQRWSSRQLHCILICCYRSCMTDYRARETKARKHVEGVDVSFMSFMNKLPNMASLLLTRRLQPMHNSFTRRLHTTPPPPNVLPLQLRPRRSMLYVPASSPRKLLSASNSLSSAIIIDLEDSIAFNAKGKAREGAWDALSAGERFVEGEGGKELTVRINQVGSEFCQMDLEVVVRTLIDPTPEKNRLTK